jgi:hypothetical protein
MIVLYHFFISIDMIKLKKLLSEISLMSGDASQSDMKDMFDRAFEKGFLPKKYRKLYRADSDEAKGIMYHSDTYKPDKEDQKENEKLVQLNKVTPKVLDYLKKYETVGSSGNYIMIMKKKGNELHFMLCDKTAIALTEFFIGVIKAEKGINTYNFTPDKAFNLKTYQIHWSNVSAENKGKGLGRLMYKMVYEYITGPLGASLVSDSTLYQGSRKMWMLYIPTIARFFGIVVNDVFFPIDRNEIGLGVMEKNVDAMVAMESIPTEIRKIANNVKGLSFNQGEYGVLRVRENINQKIANTTGKEERDFNYDEKQGRWVATKNKNFKYTYFSNLVDEARTIYGLIKEMERRKMDIHRLISNTEEFLHLKVCVFSFNNMNVIIKQGAGKLIMIPI